MKELYLVNISTILRLLKGLLIQNIVRRTVICINNIIPANSNDQLIVYLKRKRILLEREVTLDKTRFINN